MTEEATLYQLNGSDALMQSAQVIARVGNRAVILDLRSALLQAVECLEREAGIRPTTAELRRMWREERIQTNGNGRHTD